MIARIKFDYSAGEVIRKIREEKDPEKMAKLLSVIPDAGNEYFYASEALIDMETDGPLLTAMGISFSVHSFKGTMPISQVLPDGKSYTVYVQVPHIGLLTVNEVTHLDDACTDELQRHLNDGWRILAVCPPNAQRRPDYILGRTKE